ncbi:hypothetical protein DSL72_004580 [Monilinia vaccinii-corymbosi]|uniref:Uncharacterized protein n=1 Tax=Monilinia vaccinii-corymbosi TaxID=61207 RepID=A0A8A3NZL6_9HELO|nr:hypothetical protein DSL72_004580 [Monilinia vaccinii-corymbosi]
MDGINVMPAFLLGVPTAAISRRDKYNTARLLVCTLFTIGLGLFSRLDADSFTGKWHSRHLFWSPNGAPTTGTGTWNFIRTPGGVWGGAIPAAIFANHVYSLVAVGGVSNPVAVDFLVDGGAYQYASAKFVHRFFPAW